MKKVLITATVQGHIASFHNPLIKMLKNKGYEVHIAAKNDLSDKTGLKIEGADKIFDIPFARSPKSCDNIKAYKMLKKIIEENDYEVIHCNTPMGSVVTRLAAKKSRKKATKVFYTAHGFHFFKGAPITNWFFYFPVEWILSFITDKLITINTEDFNFAKKHLHAKEIEYIHGVGVEESRCKRRYTKEQARRALGIPENSKIIFSVGELSKRKNHEVIIKAIAGLERENIYYYIAGIGELENYLKDLVKKKGLDNNIVFLGYTRNIIDYFEASDLFVFPSLQEGLPVALMEAMAFGLPVVASEIRGNSDLIKNGDGGYLIDKDDILGYKKSILNLLDDEENRMTMGKINQNKFKYFEVSNVVKELEKIYEVQ